MITALLLLSLAIDAHAVDLGIPHHEQPLLNVSKPRNQPTPKKEERFKVGVKSSIPEQIISQQAGKIDPRPYSADSALPDLGKAVRNSANGVDVKMRF